MLEEFNDNSWHQERKKMKLKNTARALYIFDEVEKYMTQNKLNPKDA